MTSQHEEVLTSQQIYDGRLVKLYLDTVRLPNGQQTVREIIRHPGAVAMVPLLPDGRVILVSQHRAAVGRLMLEIPAGTLEPGEDPLLAAERELQEEIGYRPGRLDYLGLEYVAPGTTTEKIYLYLATDLVAAPLPGDEDEFIEQVTLPLEEALARVMRGEIEDGKTIAALLWVARRLGL